MQAYYTAKHGISAQQQCIDIIANNIANIGTCSFKNVRADFKGLLYNEMYNAAEPNSTDNLRSGTGAGTASTTRNFSGGVPKYTGYAADLYIDGDGFFAVEGISGTEYTRNGSFSVSHEEGGSFLVTAAGRYVLDTEGQRIELPGSIVDMVVEENGELVMDGTAFAQLDIVTFVNKDGLYSTGDSCFSASDASGEAIESDAEVRQGFLEESNVDMSLEMTRLIKAQRAFSAMSRALVIADKMDGASNNLR